MHHLIDPMVDFVFKAIFGNPAHLRLLISLLNAVLQPASPIVHVTILNPFNEKDFDDDKLTVVDLRAHDAGGAIFHVEIQAANHKALKERMLFVSADQYQAQLRAGARWTALRPVFSVWILREPLRELPKAWHHRFVLSDPDHGAVLSDHLQIHVLQLARWQAPPLPATGDPDAPPLAELDAWMYFFKDAGTWHTLPPALATPNLEEAMSVLNTISEKEEDYLRYKARLNHLRDLAQFQEDAEEAKLEAEAAKVEVEAAKQETEAARQETEAAKQEAEAARLQAEAAEQRAAAERAEKEAALAEVMVLQARLRAAGLLTD